MSVEGLRVGTMLLYFLKSKRNFTVQMEQNCAEGDDSWYERTFHSELSLSQQIGPGIIASSSESDDQVASHQAEMEHEVATCQNMMSSTGNTVDALVDALESMRGGEKEMGQDRSAYVRVAIGRGMAIAAQAAGNQLDWEECRTTNRVAVLCPLTEGCGVCELGFCTAFIATVESSGVRIYPYADTEAAETQFDNWWCGRILYTFPVGTETEDTFYCVEERDAASRELAYTIRYRVFNWAMQGCAETNAEVRQAATAATAGGAGTGAGADTRGGAGTWMDLLRRFAAWNDEEEPGERSDGEQHSMHERMALVQESLPRYLGMAALKGYATQMKAMWRLALDPAAATKSKLLCLAALFYVIRSLHVPSHTTSHLQYTAIAVALCFALEL